MEQSKQRRGAPAGNHNALKHGYYSKGFKQAELLDFSLASGMEGIEEEIALLRFEIKKAVIGKETKNIMPLVKAALALEKLIRTHQKFFGSKNEMQQAFENAILHVILPMMKGNVEDFLKWHYKIEAPAGVVLVTGDEPEKPLDTALSRTQEKLKKQLTMQNEADLP